MRIALSPQLREEAMPTVFKQGDKLTIDGVEYDFSPLGEGAVLPMGAVDCEWVTGSVTRAEGEIELTLILPHGVDASEAVRFPASLVDPPDGAIVFPA